MSSNTQAKATISAQKQANAESSYKITEADLPLHCPMDNMTSWDSHPKVFLPIEKTGSAKCPYCGADFHLEK